MAIEVRELVVKVNVTEDNNPKGTVTPDKSLLTKKLIKECVDQVMKKLELRFER